MRLVHVKPGPFLSIDRYYLADEPESPYWEVCQDGDTESIVFVDAKNSRWEPLVTPYSPIPPLTQPAIERRILEDVKKRGYPVPERIVGQDG